jgi:hypothetical protein
MLKKKKNFEVLTTLGEFEEENPGRSTCTVCIMSRTFCHVRQQNEGSVSKFRY